MKPERQRLRLALSHAGALPKAAAICAVASSLLWIGQAALIAALFAGLLTGEVSVSPPTAALGFVAMAIVRAGLNYLAEGFAFAGAERALAAERAAILAHEARAREVSEFGGAGALAALASEKLHALTPYLTRYAPAQARSGVVPIVILALAFWHSWAVGLVLLVAGPLIPVFMALVGWAAQSASEKHMDEIGSLSDLLVDRLAALADIRLLDAGTRVLEDFGEAAEGLRERTMKVLAVAFLSSTVLELFAAIGVAMVAVWVGFSLLGAIEWGAWGGGITPWAGIFLLLLTPDYFQPLRDLAAAWHDKAAANAVALDLVNWEAAKGETILGTGGDVAPLAGPARAQWQGLAAARGASEITYPDAEIAPGAKVALVGPSGSGKTTLLRLLAGLEAPIAGRIEVAGVALDAESADGWRARLGWMPQAPHFLSRSLRYNIGFGAALEQEVIDKAVLGDVIAGLPQGVNSVLGETGGGLSGGEGRRVMLARALQARPDVFLADEPTADLDRETAEAVTAGLFALAEAGATLIVATHDPELIAKMDQVVEVGV